MIRLDEFHTPLHSMSFVELEAKLQELTRIETAIHAEMVKRAVPEQALWGFIHDGGAHLYDTFAKAASEAVRITKDPNAGYRLQKFYRYVDDNTKDIPQWLKQ